MKITIIIIGILVIIGGLYLMARAKLKNIPVVDNHEDIIILTDKNFQHQTKNKIVLVDFQAEWCAPCKMMAPVLNDVADELTDNAYVGKVNIEEYQALAQKYQIRNIPTMILFKDGKEVNRIVGVKSKQYLLQEIDKIRQQSMKGNFNKLIRDSRPVVVDFHALWCSPCKMQTPVLKEIAAELGDKIRIMKIDVDQNSEIAGRYNVQSVPTLMIFRQGEIKYRQAGVHTKSQLMDVLQKHIQTQD